MSTVTITSLYWYRIVSWLKVLAKKQYRLFPHNNTLLQQMSCSDMACIVDESVQNMILFSLTLLFNSFQHVLATTTTSI